MLKFGTKLHVLDCFVSWIDWEPRQSALGGLGRKKARQDTMFNFEDHFLEGKLTFGNPVQGFGVESCCTDAKADHWREFQDATVRFAALNGT